MKRTKINETQLKLLRSFIKLIHDFSELTVFHKALPLEECAWLDTAVTVVHAPVL